jgi:hypothetical protein
MEACPNTLGASSTHAWELIDVQKVAEHGS